MKLGKLALIGTLALGGLTAVGTLNTPSASADVVQKAVEPADSWGIDNTGTLDYYIDPMPAQYKEKLSSSYKSQNWFTIVTDWSSSLTANDQVKIFRVLDNGDLSRIKTMNWTKEYDYSKGKQIAIWQTQFNDNYPPGKYVAVSYIGGKHLKSNYFTVNK